MIVNPQNLRDIYVGFNTLFNKALSETKPIYSQIASTVPSSTRIETYAWLGDIPSMREWIGDREIQNLSGNAYTIENKPFELTVGVDRDDIADDQLGIYTMRITELGAAAARHPDKLVFDLMKSGFKEKCYDGTPFFSDKHPVGKRTASNMSKKKLTMQSYIEARTAIMSQTNSKGEPLDLIPDILVVPPALEATAREILIADTINGTKNTMQGTAKPLVAPRLSGSDTMWALLCTSRALKPFIYQERKKPKLVSVTDETDTSVFMNRKFLYDVDYRGNAGFGFWQMAYGSDGSDGA